MKRAASIVKMKTQAEVKAAIKQVESAYAHVLRGSMATIETNAPRALIQLEAVNKLRILHWVLGTKYKLHFLEKPLRKPTKATPDR